MNIDRDERVLPVEEGAPKGKKKRRSQNSTEETSSSRVPSHPEMEVRFYLLIFKIKISTYFLSW